VVNFTPVETGLELRDAVGSRIALIRLPGVRIPLPICGRCCVRTLWQCFGVPSRV